MALRKAASVLRDLTDTEMDYYRSPYLTPGEDRRPTLTWPRQAPIDGEPADVTALVASYADWLATDGTVPKLFINAEPGGLLTGTHREFCRTWPSQTETTVAGIHFLQEDSPDEIGTAIADWYRKLPRL
jgi:haloalkane dehalogenase